MAGTIIKSVSPFSTLAWFVLLWWTLEQDICLIKNLIIGYSDIGYFWRLVNGLGDISGTLSDISDIGYLGWSLHVDMDRLGYLLFDICLGKAYDI